MNKTQCPHCFTVYVISDEQLRVSQSMVRCGTCKERFQAQLLSDKKVTQFDPRNVFIEPISEQDDETVARVAELIKGSAPINFKMDDFEENLNSELSIDIDDESTSISNTTTAKPFAADPERTTDYEFSEEVVDPTKHQPDTSKTQEETSLHEDAENGDTTADIDDYANDGNLIDEVNQLIEKKIIQPVETAKAEDKFSSRNGRPKSFPREHVSEQLETGDTENAHIEPADTIFSLDKKAKTPRSVWFYSFILLIIASGFTASLTYQLWLKQAISWPDDKRLQTAIAPALEALKKPLNKNLERLDIQIPERRNLSRLELVSARTAPHATRSSTILLRVSLINGAEISQPLPWLELSLNDAEGRLISRRNLSPDDYSYNNRIAEKIGPRELRKVTIELLKFPEHATGYELRLLNK